MILLQFLPPPTSREDDVEQADANKTRGGGGGVRKRQSSSGVGVTKISGFFKVESSSRSDLGKQRQPFFTKARLQSVENL